MRVALALNQRLWSSRSALARSDPIVVSTMADYDWDPTEQILREREIEVEYMSANGGPNSSVGFLHAKASIVASTLLPVHEFTCSTDSVHLVSVSLVSQIWRDGISHPPMTVLSRNRGEACVPPLPKHPIRK